LASFVTLLGFSVATWGVFQRAAWWEAVAIAAAVLGLIALVAYWPAAQLAGDAGRWINALVHILGTAGVLVLLLVPSLERWVDSHVMSG
jgi:peptidoglycan/LPS O-acetylase OafA/YrhL